MLYGKSILEKFGKRKSSKKFEKKRKKVLTPEDKDAIMYKLA